MKRDALTINSIKDLIQWNLDNTNGNQKRFVFRGHTDVAYKLIPKISRSATNVPVESHVAQDRLAKLEEYLETYLPAYGYDFAGLPVNEKHWRQLFLAQHYGAPTNLLDFSRNPLVAAFFACGNPDKDGNIFAFQIRDQKSDSRRFDVAGFENGALKSKNPFSKDLSPDLRSLFIVPPHYDKRIIAQVSIFAFFRSADLVFPLESNTGLALDSDFHTGALKFKIPKERKDAILDELNKIGINESSLFPDLHGFGRFLNWKLFNRYR